MVSLYLAALNKIVGKQSADIAVDHCVIVLLGQIFGPGIDYTWQNFIPKLNIIIQKKLLNFAFVSLLFFLINFGRCEINIKVLQHTGSNGVFANPNAEIWFDPSLIN